MNENHDPKFECWAVVEFMGHRKYAAKVGEQIVGGVAFLRIDVPHPSDAQAFSVTQLYHPNALYCITPVSEEVARKLAQRWQPVPVVQYDALPSPREDYD